MKRRFDAAMLSLCALAPAALAAWGTDGTADASHDEATVRVVGLGYTGIFRALDAVVASPAMLLPFGTRAARAGLASALVTGAASAMAFWFALDVVPKAVEGVTRRLAGDAGSPSPTLISAVCALTVMTATLGPAWQGEASSAGGAAVGALLVILAAWTARASRSVASALVLGLAASYEPLVFLAALAAAAPFLLRKEKLGPDALVAFGLGLLPIGLGVAMQWRHLRIPGIATAPILEHAGQKGMLYAVVTRDLGSIMMAAAALGAVALAGTPAASAGASVETALATKEDDRSEARRALASLLGIAAVGALAVALGGQRSGPMLAALLAASVLASAALASAVSLLARAQIPFATASAAMLVVLELVLPARAIDDTVSRREARGRHAAAVWSEIAWGTLPVAAVLFVADRGTMLRVTAARATGEMRGDLVFVPSFDVDARALAAEPKLGPLYRDLALGILPEELSLAQLAAVRPLVTTFDPRWDRGLARHFVPIGLTSTFESEPRGVSDRRAALETFTPFKERLVRVALPRQDPDLAAATGSLLRARAVTMAATGEREVLAKALDDWRPFAPDDPTANLLVRRTVTTKGPIEVRDLAPSP